jgi:hypothetical protein
VSIISCLMRGVCRPAHHHPSWVAAQRVMVEVGVRTVWDMEWHLRSDLRRLRLPTVMSVKRAGWWIDFFLLDTRGVIASKDEPDEC